MTQPKIPLDLILANLAEDAEKTQARVTRASDVLLGPLSSDVAVTPYDVVYEEDRIKLKHYRLEGDPQLKTPLLVIYALINRETMLDLQPDRSVVKTFLKEGIDLYMMDWGYPTRKDRYVTIDDHVNGYMDNVIELIRKKHDLKKINLMGICMGGSFCVMYAALHPEKIKNLITTVTPTNFDTDTGLLHVWMKNIDVDRLVDTYGNIPADLMNFGFLLLNPARLMIDKYVGFFENMDNKTFVENFVRMEKWIFDSPDVPGETFRQFIKDGYQKNLLIQSKMELGGRRVELKNITMPVLNFYGMFDHLVPPAACEMLIEKIGSTDKENVSLDTGHIGIYVSSKCQREFAPKIARWLKERDDPEEAVAAEDAPAKTIAQTAGKKPAPPRMKTGKIKPAGAVAKAKKRRPAAAAKPQATVKRMAVKKRPSLIQVISETL
ncbi:MAG: class III poly(R)-hydroxyalkanoic acid synthase subunit PhaC [Syntrophales bacterium]|nr:class III poly(R)-hydroxyalkanoic acid synthase subunit PhaC [Syntrophales bacterium]